MKTILSRKLSLIGLLALAAFNTHGQRKPIQLSDMLKIGQITNIEVDEKSDKLFYSIKSAKKDSASQKDYTYQQLWYSLALDRPNEALPVLSDQKNSVQSLKVSPGGKRIVYEREVNGKPQLFLLENNQHEGKQITHFPYGASNPIWSLDGKFLLFSTTVSLDEILADTSLQVSGEEFPHWDIEKPGYSWESYAQKGNIQPNMDGSITELRAYLHENANNKKAKVIDKLQFQTESYTTGELRFTHYFKLDFTQADSIQPVGIGYRSYSNPYFINNNEILFQVKKDNIHPDRNNSNAIYTYNLKDNQWKQLLYDEEYQYQLQAVDQTAQRYAYTKQKANTLTTPDLYWGDLKKLENKAEIIELDLPKDNVRFGKDAKTIYFTAVDDGEKALYEYDIRKRNLLRISEQGIGIQNVELYKQQTIQIRSSINNPYEIFSTDAKGKNPKLLTDVNASWIADRNLGRIEKFRFANETGDSVSYWLLKPENVSALQKYPLVVEIHGGPAGYFGLGDPTMWLEYQYFAARGYAVLFGNPRGSSGYSTHFLAANYKDWGTGPALDVLKAVDLTVDKDSKIDTANLFVTGGSYGGYLTTWILAHDRRFAAGSSQRGVYDLHTFFGEGNVWTMIKRYFGGYPWEDGVSEVLRENSVLDIAHHIETPLLIFHGEQDLRTGIAQSERLYKTLKTLGRPVEYVRHPGATHEITRSGDWTQRLDQLSRTYDFFERFRK